MVQGGALIQYGCFYVLKRSGRGTQREDAAAAAKSLQLCLIRSDPMACSLRGSSIHGIFQARVLEWVAIAFSKGRWLCENRGRIRSDVRIAGSHQILELVRNNLSHEPQRIWLC